MIESKTGLRYGDIILSKTAYPTASFVNLEECNVSQDTIAIRLFPKWCGKLFSGFIVAFLNSRYGLALMERQFQGNVQAHLSLPDGKKLPLPLLSKELQADVHKFFEAAHQRLEHAAAEMKKAEQTLLRVLGLENWQPPEPLTYTRCASEAFAANRIDSDFYSPAKYAALQALAALPHRLLGDRCHAIREMFDPAKSKPNLKVRNFDVTDALQPALDDEKEPVLVSELGSAKKQFRKGDVVISRLRSYLREIAVVRTSTEVPVTGSSEFIVLRPREDRHPQVTPETLMIFLRSFPVQTVLRYCQDGSQHPRFSDEDLLSIAMPDAALENSSTIDGLVNSALDARREARAMLECAKRAVEIAIEVDEATALRYLDKRPE